MMRLSIYLLSLLLLPIAATTMGCQKQDGREEVHFGPNPHDGIVDDETSARE